MQSLEPPGVIEKIENNEAPGKINVGDLRAAATIAALMMCLSALWFAFDHHIPNNDEAGHILTGMQFRDLFSHPNPFRVKWWHEIITASPFYPPAAYFPNGLIKLISDAPRMSDAATECLYYGLLSLSTFACAKQLGVSRLGACIAGLLICLYPEILGLTHRFLLDLPLVAMISAGFSALLYWEKQPSLKRSFLAGTVVGLACLTKQLAAPFLAGAGLLLIIRLFKREKPAKIFCSIAVLVLGAAIVGLPWLCANYGYTIGYADYQKRCMSQSTNFVDSSFGSNLASYLESIIRNSSFALFLAAAVSFVCAGKKWHLKLLPLTASSALGIIALSCCSASVCRPDDRYTLTALIPMAIYTGIAAEKLLSGLHPIKTGLFCLLSVLAILQFLALNFTPYPLSGALLPIAEFLDKLPSRCRSDHKPPVHHDEWGTEEVLNYIDSRTGKTPTYLNILSNQAEINAHSYQLLAKERKSALTPTCVMQWSHVGDRVDFSPESAQYYHWHLIRSGNTGFMFINPESESNYYKLKNFIARSGKFELVWSKKIPNGETLYLYKLKTLAL